MLTQLDATIHLLKALPNAGDDDRPLLNIARTRLTDLAQKLDTNLDRLNNPSSRSPR
ncbi:hypothetical protein ACX3T3_03850 [Actinotignum schaalii]